VFLKRFAASVEHITGQEDKIETRPGSDSSVEEELEALRSKVEQLSDEVSRKQRISRDAEVAIIAERATHRVGTTTC